MWLGLLCCVGVLQVIAAYKPVILIHGFMANSNSFQILKTAIEQAHPGTNVTALNIFPHYYSINPLWHQVQSMKSHVQRIAQSSPEGVHLIGFSQGGILARGIIEALDDHNVDTFISLSAPQMGMYGAAVLRNIPIVANTLAKNAHMILYSPIGQFLSFAGYWRDPYHLNRYRSSCLYLPVLNNEINHRNSNDFKNNFIKLKKLVLVGGPNDQTILPWQSSVFGFYKENSNVIADIRDQQVYKDDTFGLRTLDERGALHIDIIPEINHIGFVIDKNVIENNILPHLT